MEATEYRLGWYRKPTEHHGKPVLLKVRKCYRYTLSSKDGYTNQPRNSEIVGHVYLLKSTWRRILKMLHAKEQRQKNKQRKALANALTDIRHTKIADLPSRN